MTKLRLNKSKTTDEQADMISSHHAVCRYDNIRAAVSKNAKKGKDSFRFQKIIPVILIILFSAGMWNVGWGQALLLTDDFTGYSSNLAGNTGGSPSGIWTKGGSGPDATIANTTTLTYPGYNGGGGNYVSMPTGTSTASRVYKGFTSTTAVGNTFYVSFLLRITSTTATGDYFITLGDPTTGTTYAPRLFAKSSGAGYVIGASKAANVGTATFGNSVLSFNTTYLIVIRYTGVTGTTNDLTYVWVNPSLASEPSTGAAEVTVPSGEQIQDFQEVI